MNIMNIFNNKRFSRIASLCLALSLCLSLGVAASAADPTVSASGGSASSSVTLSSTADGTLDGTPAATAMSVTVPTALPVAVGTDGTVTTATNAKITNNSYGAVKVSTVTINAGDGWKLTAFGPASSLAGEKVDSNQVGFAMNIGGGSQLATKSGSTATQALLTQAADGCYMTGAGDAENNYVAIDYDAIVTPLSNAVTNTAIASVVFVVEWDT
jgi:hypothetical protein